MRKVTFQIGANDSIVKRPDAAFLRALDAVRNAVSGPTPVVLRGRRRLPTRHEARLRTLTSAS